MLPCTRCETWGFLSIEQVPDDIVDAGHEAVLEWIELRDTHGPCACHIKAPCPACESVHDVSVCDCCGDTESWYGEPGFHYGPTDPAGDDGPYQYNGGLCECH